MIYSVRIWLKLAASGLLLIMMSVPLMACMVPAGQLTATEQECCQKMAMNCGSTAMPASHSCCQPQVRGADSALVARQVKLSHDSRHGTLQGLASIAPVCPRFASLHADVEPVADSPPGAAVSIQVLRI